MKKIYVNLKRFDVSPDVGGINRIAALPQWGTFLTKEINAAAQSFAGQASCTVFLPEMHLLSAVPYVKEIQIGCQSVSENDVGVAGNFGAMTTQRSAQAMREAGVTDVIIGHCEERNQLKKYGLTTEKINHILNQRVQRALAAKLDLLFCIGETAEEQENWQATLKQQIEQGLEGIDATNIVLAYEPVWAIGPGKTPPTAEKITEIVDYIKTIAPYPVVYGGGLKEENALMLGKIACLDGGLIALTNFTGDIGFYPETFTTIVHQFLQTLKEESYK